MRNRSVKKYLLDFKDYMEQIGTVLIMLQIL